MTSLLTSATATRELFGCRLLPDVCSGCGLSFRPTGARITLPQAICFHLERRADCVETYCDQAEDLVDLEEGKLGIRQTLHPEKIPGWPVAWGIVGISPSGERRVFFLDCRRAEVKAWLKQRLENGHG